MSSAAVQLDNIRTSRRLSRQAFKLDLADIAGGAAGLALGATVLRGMDLGPIPFRVNSALGLIGLALLFTDPAPTPNRIGPSPLRKFVTSFCLGAGSERVFEYSQERLGDLFSGLTGGRAG